MELEKKKGVKENDESQNSNVFYAPYNPANIYYDREGNIVYNPYNIKETFECDKLWGSAVEDNNDTITNN